MAVPAEAPRVPGRVQSPGAVVGLSLVTLGIYAFAWAWRVTKEADAWRGSDLRAHAAFRRSTVLLLVALVPYVAGLAFLLLLFREGDRPDVAPAAAAAALVFVALALVVAGAVFFYVALWRVWRTIEDDERSRGVAALSPALLLVVMLVPYVNLVGWFYAVWRTQKGLNGMYEAAGAPTFVPAPA